MFDSLAAGLALPNFTRRADATQAGIRFPPPPKSTRDLVNDAFGFDPSAEQGNVGPHHAAGDVADEQPAGAKADRRLARQPTPCSPKSLSTETDNAAAVTRLYQQVLARKPTPKEIDIAQQHVASVGDRKTGFEDLLWSMVNSAEFLSRR